MLFCFVADMQQNQGNDDMYIDCAAVVISYTLLETSTYI